MPANTALVYGSFSILDRLMNLTDQLALLAPEETSMRHFPPLQIIEDDDALYIRVLLPGLSREHIGLSIHDATLTIFGSAPPIPGRHLRRDRPAGSFRRDVRLPFRTDIEAARAVISNGILTVTLPKHMAMQKRSIPVATANGEFP